MSPAAWGDSPVPVLAGLEGMRPRTRPDTTPLIGVMLTLLIIFMVLTPAITKCVKFPRALTAEVLRGERPQLGIDQDGRFYVGDRMVPDLALGSALAAEMAAWPGHDELLLSADADVAYPRVEVALDAIRETGVRRVLIEADLPYRRRR